VATPKIIMSVLFATLECVVGKLSSKELESPLRTVLASLAEGDSPQQILDDFPTLKPEDIQAAIVFAANN
jgi:uncharacterized protein (DUF433 family)